MKKYNFEEMCEAVGKNLAIFYFCMMEDSPFIIEISNRTDIKNWDDYITYVENEGHDYYAGQKIGFLDGDHDVKTIINLSADEFERQQMVWGVGHEDKPYTVQDYKRLDELFKTFSARLVAAGGYDAQQEDTLRSCCKMRLIADRSLALGTKDGVAMHTQLNKTIQELLSSENLRKKDAKPIEEQRLDSITAALEKAGIKMSSLEEVQDSLLKRLGIHGGKPSHKYPYTLDAADQMLTYIVNTMRINDGLPEIPYDPRTPCLDENVACEFAENANEEEKKNFESLGLIHWGSAAKKKARK